MDRHITGVMTLSDKKSLDLLTTPHGKWWVPFTWCFNIIKDARKEGRITDDFLLKTVLEEVMSYRSSLGTLYSYDWISIPLVYTQVTSLAVYAFFLGCVLGRQFLDPAQHYPGHDVDLYVPVFTLLQFFFYMGWLKVAEQMINPFGEDDDDFDMNWIIDRNLQVSLLSVDNMYMQYPVMERDMYWDEHPPECLPYTKSAMSSLRQPFMGSTAELNVSDDGMQIVNPMETINENATLEFPYVNPTHLACESPLASPCRTPRPAHRVLNNLYTQGSTYKLALSSMQNLEKPVLETIHGPVKPEMTYLETWLKDANKRAWSKIDICDRHHEVGTFRPRSDSSTTVGRRQSNVRIESPLCTPEQNCIAENILPAVTKVGNTHSQYTLDDQPPAYTETTTCNTPDAKQTVPVTPAPIEATVIDMPQCDSESPKAPILTIQGSNGSLHEYAGSDDSQSTVNSLAPLLKDYQEATKNV